MRKFDCVIFDLDGTLLDTLDDLTKAVNHTMKVFGCPLHTKEEVRTFVGNGIYKLLERAMPEEKQGEVGHAYGVFCEYYGEHFADETTPYAGMPALLSRLSQAGVRLGVVSNKAEFAVGRLVKKFYPNTFGAVVGAREDLPKKPAPDGVLSAMQRLGAKKERTVYVGDSDVDYYTAKNAGLPVAAVSWGFRPASDFADLPVYALCGDAAALERVLTEEI